MALSDLTEKAVLHAIAEFDALHREPFLKKYGFSKSSGYFLVYKGKSYDSKAIAGAAHAYIGGVFQPLRASNLVEVTRRSLDATALEPDEMLMEVELPVAQPRSGAAS